MARILLHYDIADANFRAMVEQTITDSKFQPTFTRVTDSVYEANFSMIPRDAAALVRTLRACFVTAPAGTTIVLETPVDGPTIYPEIIVRT